MLLIFSYPFSKFSNRLLFSIPPFPNVLNLSFRQNTQGCIQLRRHTLTHYPYRCLLIQSLYTSIIISFEFSTTMRFKSSALLFVFTLNPNDLSNNRSRFLHCHYGFLHYAHSHAVTFVFIALFLYLFLTQLYIPMRIRLKLCKKAHNHETHV